MVFQKYCLHHQDRDLIIFADNRQEAISVIDRMLSRVEDMAACLSESSHHNVQSHMKKYKELQDLYAQASNLHKNVNNIQSLLNQSKESEKANYQRQLEQYQKELDNYLEKITTVRQEISQPEGGRNYDTLLLELSQKGYWKDRQIFQWEREVFLSKEKTPIQITVLDYYQDFQKYTPLFYLYLGLKYPYLLDMEVETTSCQSWFLLTYPR